MPELTNSLPPKRGDTGPRRSSGEFVLLQPPGNHLKSPFDASTRLNGDFARLQLDASSTSSPVGAAPRPSDIGSSANSPVGALRPGWRTKSRWFTRATVGLAGLTLLVAAGCSQAADEPTRTGDQGNGQNGYVSVAEKSVTLIPPAQRKPAPDISGVVLGEKDKELSTADLKGKVVVLNVWGSWCGPCRAEAPDLQRASVKTAKVAQFVGLNTRDFDQGPPAAFARAFKITYPSIWDPTGSVLVALSGTLPPTAIPSTLIIDPQGRVAARVVGVVGENTLVEMINDIAAGK